jgi:hypothetical protein
LDALHRRGRLERLTRHRDAIRAIEAQVVDFAHQHTGRFSLVLLFEILTCAIGIAETTIVLAVTTGRASWLVGFLLDSTYRAINTAFAFVPMAVGIDEGSSGLALSALGYRVADGVTLGIVRKARDLIWIAAGILLLLVRWRD